MPPPQACQVLCALLTEAVFGGVCVLPMIAVSSLNDTLTLTSLDFYKQGEIKPNVTYCDIARRDVLRNFLLL